MKKLLPVIIANCVFCIANGFASPEIGVATEEEQFKKSYNETKAACSGMLDKIGKIKVAAGIGVGVGAVGVVAGVSSAVGGAKDKAISNTKSDTKEARKPGDEADGAETKKETFKDKVAAAAPAVQTAGSYVAGGAAAGGAISSFISADLFEKLKEDSVACNKGAVEVDKIAIRLQVEHAEEEINPDTTTYGGVSLKTLTEVAFRCRELKGFDPASMTKLKNTMIAMGIVSIAGAAAGIAGGVVSQKSHKDSDKDNKQHDASIGLAAGAGAANLAAGGVNAGIIMSLNRKDDDVKRCVDAFK